MKPIQDPKSEQKDVDLLTELEKNILNERANALNKKIETSIFATESIEVTEFVLATEHYGIETSFIEEVHTLKEHTFVPCTPDYVYGIMNIRGEIVSIIDLKVLLGLPQVGITDLKKVIIIHNSHMKFGVLADHIIGVGHIPIDHIQNVPQTLNDEQKMYLRGLTKNAVIILDADKLLLDKDLVVHEEV